MYYNNKKIKKSLKFCIYNKVLYKNHISDTSNALTFLTTKCHLEIILY